MFRGQYEHTMDGKGRISVPARFREVLAELDVTGENADRIILTRTFEQCLVVYPMDRWLDFEEKIRQLPQFNPHVQRLKRVYVAGAVEASIDSHGRLLVPQAMRDYAHLDRNCVWVGQLETVELWSQQSWQGAMDQALTNPQELTEAMAELGL